MAYERMTRGEWSTVETLKTETYGTLKGCFNNSAKLAALTWAGTGSAPSSQVYEITLSNDYRPKDDTYFGVPMKNGSGLSVTVSNNVVKATVRLSTVYWSEATLIYPLD